MRIDPHLGPEAVPAGRPAAVAEDQKKRGLAPTAKACT
jgi:hypothetical protein